MTTDETEIQKSVIQWWEVWAPLCCPELLIYVDPLMAVVHGNHGPRTGKHLKEMGLKKGVFDLCLEIKTEKYSSLKIEIKRPKTILKNKGSVSIHQKNWMEHYKKHGHNAQITYGFDETIESIIHYVREYQEQLTRERT